MVRELLARVLILVFITLVGDCEACEGDRQRWVLHEVGE